MTQIMNLLLLAPDIQEAILFLPRVTKGEDPLHLRRLQPIALTPDWNKQREIWRDIGPAASTDARRFRHSGAISVAGCMEVISAILCEY